MLCEFLVSPGSEVLGKVVNIFFGRYVFGLIIVILGRQDRMHV